MDLPAPVAGGRVLAALTRVARIIASATFAVRQTTLWGEGTTAVASDSTPTSPPSTKTSSPSGTPRYRRAKHGVLIYWAVEVAGPWPCTAS
jgi:TnpA family transposase